FHAPLPSLHYIRPAHVPSIRAHHSYPIRNCLPLPWRQATLYLEFFSSLCYLRLLERIQYDLRISVLPSKVDEVVIIPQLKETGVQRVTKGHSVKHVFPVIRRSWCHHQVWEQGIMLRCRIV